MLVRIFHLVIIQFTLFRHQDKNQRPDFSEVVDSLTEILQDTPESKHTEDINDHDTLDNLIHK